MQRSYVDCALCSILCMAVLLEPINASDRKGYSRISTDRWMMIRLLFQSCSHWYCRHRSSGLQTRPESIHLPSDILRFRRVSLHAALSTWLRRPVRWRVLPVDTEHLLARRTVLFRTLPMPSMVDHRRTALPEKVLLTVGEHVLLYSRVLWIDYFIDRRELSSFVCFVAIKRLLFEQSFE